jgi:hypothetical protein
MTGRDRACPGLFSFRGSFFVLVLVLVIEETTADPKAFGAGRHSENSCRVVVSGSSTQF